MASVTVCQIGPDAPSSRPVGQRVASVSRPESLRRPADFRRILDTGSRQRVGDLVVVKRPGQSNLARYGLVAGKRTGNAVQRNRIKRRLRAIVAAVGLPAGYDYVLLAGHQVGSVDYRTLEAWLSEAVR